MHPTYVVWNKVVLQCCMMYTEHAPKRQQFHQPCEQLKQYSNDISGCAKLIPKINQSRL